MKTISSEARALIESGAVHRAGAAKFVFAQTWRYWSGHGPLTIADETYEGVGAAALMTPIASELGGGSDGVTITLTDLDPDVAQAIEAQDYHQRPCLVYELIFDVSRTNLIAAVVFLRGRVDTMVVRETVGGASLLAIQIEGPRRDMSRHGARLRSDADQRLLGGALDGGLRHVTHAGRKTLSWGRRPAVAAQALGGSVSPGAPSLNDFSFNGFIGGIF